MRRNARFAAGAVMLNRDAGRNRKLLAVELAGRREGPGVPLPAPAGCRYLHAVLRSARGQPRNPAAQRHGVFPQSAAPVLPRPAAPPAPAPPRSAPPPPPPPPAGGAGGVFFGRVSVLVITSESGPAKGVI